jgi:hypothetical protein
MVPVNRPCLRRRFASRLAPTGEVHLVFVGACLQANKAGQPAGQRQPVLPQATILQQADSYRGGASCLCGQTHLKLKLAFFWSQVQNKNMSNDQDTQIATDGLRYKSKEGGSPFRDSSNGMTMSCYKCGFHKPRSMGIFKLMINQRMFMCRDCMPAKAA